MSEKNTIWTDPGKILSIFQLILLIVTLTYLFAYLQKDVERNTERINIQTDQLREYEARSRATYVRRDVFNEQYRQIIERLDKLNQKLDDGN